MKIAIDARMITRSGIGTCIREWMPRVGYSIALGNPKDLEPFQEFFASEVPFDCGIYGYKEQLRFPYRKLKRLSPDILHVPHFNVPLFYRGKMLVTIHDLTHLIYPQFLPFRAAVLYFKFMIRFAAGRASRILTDSESTKRDLIRFFRTPEEKISVVPLGVGEEFMRKPPESVAYLYSKYSIPQGKKLLLYVGNLLPHKNLSKLIEAFSLLPNREAFRLILVGKAFDGRTGKSNAANLGVESEIIRAGTVSQEDLVNLYNLADLSILPSLYEGFGLPVLESMACGTPVACSDRSSLPEVGGSLARYFDPENAEDMAHVISQACTLKTSLSDDCIAWAKKFNWENSARTIRQIAEEVLHEG